MFAGEVMEIVDVDLKRDASLPAPRRVRVRVLEAFAGIESAETEVFTENNEAMCGYTFAAGGRYLVFAFDYPDGRRGVTLCSLTRPMGRLNGDLSYLRALKASAPESLVGRLRGRATYAEQRYGPPQRPFAGARIFARGADDRTVEVVTDREGRFEIVAPVGRYALSVEVSDALHAQLDFRAAWILDPRACGELQVRVRPDGHVAGRVVTEDGSPLAHVAVTLGQPKDVSRLATSYGAVARTDAFGRFDVGQLPPGQYVLGLLVPRAPDRSNPPVPVLMSSEQGRATVREINVSNGGRLDVGDFVVRDIPPLITLSGLVVDLSNRPLRNVSVELTAPRDRIMRIGPVVISDDAGRFSFAVVAGSRYGLRARLYSHGFWGAWTELPEILASGDAAPVILTLPIPGSPVPRVR